MKIANNTRCLPQALIALLLIAGGASEAFAQSVNVNVTGNITGECRITGGASLTIPLGDVAASSFTGMDSFSPTDGMQNITLTCTSSPGIRMTMSGTPYPGTASVLQLTGAGNPGVATGVGIQLLYSTVTTGTPTTLLQRDTPVVIPTGNTVTVRVGARYNARVATPTAGVANTTATLTFTVN